MVIRSFGKVYHLCGHELANRDHAKCMAHEHGDGGQQGQEAQAVLHGAVEAAARCPHVGEGGNGRGR